MLTSRRFQTVGWMLLTWLVANSAKAADWPQYRGVLGDGASNESINDTSWSAAGPYVRWRVETSGGFSSFAVAEGRVFTQMSRPAADGGHAETCVALDADTGSQLWHVRLGSSDYDHGGGNSGAPGNRGGDGPRSTPAADGDRVYVYEAHMVLSCFDAATGNVVWRQDVINDFAGRKISWLNATSPLLDEQRVYVSGGGPGQSFLAFDRQDGRLIWASGDEMMTHATPRLATLDGVRQVIFFAQSGLVSVTADTGQELWRCDFPYSTSTAASPVVSGDQVYCSAGYGVGAGVFRVGKASENVFEVETVWFKPNKLMNHWSTPIERKSHLYGIYEFKKYGTAPLQCVDVATGEIKWSERGFGPGNCILVGDKLVVLSDEGEVVIAKATTERYAELARFKAISGKCWSTPAFSNGRLYVRSTTEGACLDLATAR